MMLYVYLRPCIKLCRSGVCINRRSNSTLRTFSSVPYKGVMSFQSNSNNDDGGPGKHVAITSESTRKPVVSKAIVTEMNMESPSVKTFTFEILNPKLKFLAGQWIDMFIPGVKTVGGFSMYSSPHELEENKIIKLGVKVAKWPPAHWLHNQCKIGSDVMLQVGGDFYFNPSNHDKTSDILLLAGGVGVNPLASIYQYVAHLNTIYNNNKNQYKPGRVKLLYSSKSNDEILYKNMLDELAERDNNIEVEYFVTDSNALEEQNIRNCHINKDILSKALNSLNNSSLLVYICGPPPMIEDMNSHLLDLGVPDTSINYEKWW